MLYKGKVLSSAERRKLLPELMKEHLRHWLDSGMEVFLLEQVPEHPYVSIEMAAFFTHTTPGEKLTTRNDFLQKVFQEINHPNLHYIPTVESFRTGDSYFFIKDGKLLYTDFNHVNYFGAQQIIPALQPFFDHLLARRGE